MNDRVLIRGLLLALCLLIQPARGAVTGRNQMVGVKTAKGKTIQQKRWILENEFVRLAVIDDPGGAVVEFVNKKTGVNHVAGQAYVREVKGKLTKKVGWGWCEFIYDDPTDPIEKMMRYQKFDVAFEDGPKGAKTIKVTGRTAEQQVERWHTLRPDSGELLVRIRLTNIAKKTRRLWLRWHPYSYASSDRFGDAACVLSPGEGDQVRKIRVGWGWDHWFRTHDGYWMAADFRTGEGLFMTFQKEKVPVHFTWTYYKRRNPLKGAVTLEPFPEVQLAKPGEAIESQFTYFPFTKETAPDAIPMGVLTDATEQARAKRFLRNAKPLDHLKLFGAHTFAKSIQFKWHHRRRDLFGLRDWGFADCAIMGYPSQDMSIKVRMVGAFFDETAKRKNFWPRLEFRIRVTNPDGVAVYANAQTFPLKIGLERQNALDRELAIPMKGMPDGTYTLRVEAMDPFTRKPFHHHETQVEVFGKRLKVAEESLRKKLDADEKDRPFVTALASLKNVAITNGVARIPIGVEDGSGVARKGFPVRLGVPLPKDAFAADAPRRLLSPEGKVVPAQFRVMNRWPGKSLKWLQVDFQADCPADGFAFYTLEIGKGVASEPAGTLIAKETPEHIELDTGALLLRINRKKLTVPGELFLDSNGDGRFADGERVVSASQAGDAWWEDGSGRKYHMDVTGPASGIFAPGVRIESNGPLSAIVKAQGWYTDAQGKRPAYGEIRIEVHRGKPFLKIWHQVTFTGSPWQDRLGSYGLTLRFKPNLYKQLAWAIDGKAEVTQGSGSIHQRSSNQVALTGRGHEARQGQRASGALLLKSEAGQCLVYHRELWQMFPKKMTADPANGEVTIHYWPKESGPKDFGPLEEYWIPSSSSAEACATGLSRTQELVLDFADALKVTQAEAIHHEPVVACTPPKWVQTTRVLNNLHPYNPEKYPQAERYIHDLVDFYNRNRDFFNFYGQWDYGTLHNVFEVPLYRWLVIGRYANIGNEENIAQAPWLAWFRSGDRKFLKFARVWTRHIMEIQSIRWHNTFPEWAGMSRRHHYTPWIGGGDWGHTMLCPWLEYYHATGYRPAWDMAQHTAETMANTYKGSWRYVSNPIIGNTRMYLETGDEKYKAVADRIWKDLCDPDRGRWYYASHGARMATWYGQINKDCAASWKEWSRNGRKAGKRVTEEFQYLDGLGTLGDLTGDPFYAHRVRMQFDGFLNGYTGRTSGTNPVYRGMVHTFTQFSMGNARMLPHAVEQIAKSEKLFPAKAYFLGYVREVVVREEKDQDFTIWMSVARGGAPKILGPDRKPATITSEVVASGTYSKRKKATFLKITVKKDGQSGLYRIPGMSVVYFGSSLKGIAFRLGDSLRGGVGASVYARSDDLGAPKARFLMQGAPSTSLEIFSLDGKRLFSATHVRPHEDAMGIEEQATLPTGTVVRFGDRSGVRFLTGKNVILYADPETIFELR
jgi:PcRGLX-like protein C-terminal alpha/alpha toroid domain